jgi:hypothetical protein
MSRIKLLSLILLIPVIIFAGTKPKFVKYHHKIVAIQVDGKEISYGMDGWSKYVKSNARVNKGRSLNRTVKACIGKWIESQSPTGSITLHDFSKFDEKTVDYILRDHILKWNRKVRVVKPWRN